MAEADIIKPKPKTRRCSRCGRVRKADRFGPSAKDKRGLQKHCKECHRERMALRHQRLRVEDPDHEWRGVLRRKYGITVEQYHAMAEAQGQVCAICGGSVERRFHVDHCHASGVVRGLLCQFCNTGLGMFRDEPDRLRSAAEYLERHGTQAVFPALVNARG